MILQQQTVLRYMKEPAALLKTAVQVLIKYLLETRHIMQNQAGRTELCLKQVKNSALQK